MCGFVAHSLGLRDLEGMEVGEGRSPDRVRVRVAERVRVALRVMVRDGDARPEAAAAVRVDDAVDAADDVPEDDTVAAADGVPVEDTVAATDGVNVPVWLVLGMGSRSSARYR